jgi:hypothetical protein
MANAQQQQLSASQVNQIARSAIKARAVRMLQGIYNQTWNPTQQPTITINPRNVGLINGFWVKVTAVISNSSAAIMNLTDFGPANLLSQIQFNDLSNNTRIQTPGWHLAFLNSWKTRRAFASALTSYTGKNSGTQLSSAGGIGEDSPINFGSNFTTISAPASIPAIAASVPGTGTLTMWYYVPLAYNPDNPQMPDLRGAVYANVVNATMQLFLSFAGTYGTQLVAANGADATSAVYQQASAEAVDATVTSASVTVYQDYWDQLPTGNQGVLLPILDLATIYELKQTVQTAIPAGQDFPYQYANFRDFLSTIAIFVNNGSTGARGVGGDINYWALQSANFTNIWKIEPALSALMTRQHLGLDLPPGTYLFDSRNRPISTTQYGNMQLIINASSASSNPYMLVAVEDFALVQTLSMAGSLAAS